MYQVIKVLNNNGIIVKRKESNKEYIFLGKGIGFGRKIGDQFDSYEDAKVYKLQEDSNLFGEKNDLDHEDIIYLEIANEIIVLAEKQLGEMDEGILLLLAEHIAYAVKRRKNGMIISNPLSEEISVLFSDEYEVAKQAVDIIQKYKGIIMDKQEIGYIALHLHSAVMKSHVSNSLNILSCIGDLVTMIEEETGEKVNRDSLSYTRFITHIKYMILRALKKEAPHVDMTSYVKKEFPESYELSVKTCILLGNELSCDFSDAEISYLAVHIERLSKSSKNRNN